jgi:hypothetical protein
MGEKGGKGVPAVEQAGGGRGEAGDKRLRFRRSAQAACSVLA